MCLLKEGVIGNYYAFLDFMAITWVLGIQILVLPFVLKALCPLNHLPSHIPTNFCLCDLQLKVIYLKVVLLGLET